MKHRHAGCDMPSFALRVTRAAATVCAAVLAASSFRGAAVGLRNPTGLALDTAGTLYVANAGDSTIAIFAPGAQGRTAPVGRIGGPATGFITPQGVALDSHGRIYTSNERRRIQGYGSVTVYKPDADGNAAPVRTIMGRRTQLRSPVGVALGPGGKIYVANGSGPAALAFSADADGDVEPERRLAAVQERESFRGFDDRGATDIAAGEDGSLLVADTRGVTAHMSGAWLRRYTVGGVGGRFAQRPRVGAARGGEFYVARQPPDSLPPGATQADSFKARFFSDRQAVVALYGPPGRGDTAPLRILGGPAADLGAIADLAVGPGGSLYVVGNRGQRGSTTARVAIYSSKAVGDVPPVRVIEGPRTGLVSPASIAVDRAGRIYVTNNGLSSDSVLLAPSVTVYAPDAVGNASPMRTIAGMATRLSRPAAVAVADDGTVYVANLEAPGGDQGSITVHSPTAAGDESPLRTLIGPGSGLVEPRGFAVGPGDTLYVVLGSTIYSGYEPVYGRGAPAQVNVYPPGASGGTAPVRILKGSETDLGNPRAVAVDAAGRMYVTDYRRAAGSNAYGPDLGDISVFRAGATGNEAPLRIIAGSRTRLNGPGVPALDRSGNIYVPNRWGTGPGSVTVYGPDADGDVRPLRIIAGPATGLRAPSAVALDCHDTLYVANLGVVTVYAPRANGNVAPVRAIEPP